MSGLLIGTLILWLIVAIIVVVVAVYVVNWLYHRSSKEVSFVRTGFLGERVVINGGAFVLPFIHDFTPVNMNVLPMQIVREKGDAVITRDRMRIDIEADFYVRVEATREAVSIAAATLGRRTLEPERLARAAVRQVRLRAPLGRLRNDDGADARAARRICRAGESRGGGGAGAERPRTRIGRDHRSRPDRPRILQSAPTASTPKA